MKVIIEITPYPEDADPANHTGLTEEAYSMVMAALSGIAEDIDIRRA